MPNNSRDISSTNAKGNEVESSTAIASENPTEVLKRGFSVQPVVPNLDLSEAMSRAKPATEELMEYRVIGTGTCGTVFEIPGTEVAVKKGRDTRAMWNDFILTNTVHNAFVDIRELLQVCFPKSTLPEIPQCIDFWLPDFKWYWQTNINLYPMTHREVGTAFHIDRIPPLPKSIREALIGKFFNDREQEGAKEDKANESCLVRIYLGANEEKRDYNSLRNFPMRLNMIEELNVDKSVFAKEIAIALAVIHWQAQVDAMGIKFVLGSARATRSDRRRAYTIDPAWLTLFEAGPTYGEWGSHFTMRPIHLWVLDFDKASTLYLTAKHVDTMLVPAFLRNDPYYPMPHVDRGLWQDFAATYLKASRAILESKQKKTLVLRLPKRFIDKIIAMA